MSMAIGLSVLPDMNLCSFLGLGGLIGKSLRPYGVPEEQRQRWLLQEQQAQAKHIVDPQAMDIFDVQLEKECQRLGLDGLAEQELKLHSGQTNNALYEIWLALANKVVLFQTKVPTAYGQGFEELRLGDIDQWLEIGTSVSEISQLNPGYKTGMRTSELMLYGEAAEMNATLYQLDNGDFSLADEVWKILSGWMNGESDRPTQFQYLWWSMEMLGAEYVDIQPHPLDFITYAEEVSEFFQHLWLRDLESPVHKAHNSALLEKRANMLAQLDRNWQLLKDANEVMRQSWSIFEALTKHFPSSM
ncbi:hypothetical protein HD554DRAFT_2041116 [Boletus coccyginus]|nr:hypothetical protein HD554DRAFT_2041116 [Boletus coccyginus]